MRYWPSRVALPIRRNASRAATVPVINRLVHERFFLRGNTVGCSEFFFSGPIGLPRVLWPRAANKTKEMLANSSVSRAQPGAAIKNAFHGYWCHDLLELGMVALISCSGVSTARSSVIRAIAACSLALGTSRPVDNIKTDGATRLSLAAAGHTARAGYRFIRRRRLRR